MKNEFRVTIEGVENGDTLRLTGEHPEHVSKPSLYPKKIMTVRSTAGLIRYLALQSTIVQWNFHSHRRIRILEIFHYPAKIPYKILIFDGNEMSFDSFKNWKLKLREFKNSSLIQS